MPSLSETLASLDSCHKALSAPYPTHSLRDEVSGSKLQHAQQLQYPAPVPSQVQGVDGRTALAAELAMIKVEIARQKAAAASAREALSLKDHALQQLAQSSAQVKVALAKAEVKLQEKEELLEQLGTKFVKVQQGSADNSVAKEELEARLANMTRKEAETSQLLAAASEAAKSATLRAEKAESRAADAASESAARGTRITALEGELRTLQDSMQRLRKQMDASASESEKQRQRELVGANKRHLAEVAGLEAKLKVSERLVQSTQKTRDALQGKLSDARMECESLKAELAAREEELAAAQQAAGASAEAETSAAEELQRLLGEIEQHQAQIKDLLGQVHEVTEANEELRQEKEGVEGQLRAQEFRMQHLQDAAKEAETSEARVRAAIKLLGDRHSAAEQQVQRLEAKLKLLAKELLGSRKASRTAQKAHTRAAAELETVTAKLAAAEAELQRAQEKATTSTDVARAAAAQKHVFQEAMENSQRAANLATFRLMAAEGMLMAGEDRLSNAVEAALRREEQLAASGGWEVQPVNERPPPMTMGNKVIEGIIHNWTSDKKKQAFVKKWLDDMAGPRPVNFKKSHPRLELAKLSDTVRDGFLMMIIPLLKVRHDIRVDVARRVTHETRTDLRISITPAGMSPADEAASGRGFRQGPGSGFGSGSGAPALMTTSPRSRYGSTRHASISSISSRSSNGSARSSRPASARVRRGTTITPRTRGRSGIQGIAEEESLSQAGHQRRATLQHAVSAKTPAKKRRSLFGL